MGNDTDGDKKTKGVGVMPKKERVFHCTPETPYKKGMKDIDVVECSSLDMRWNSDTESMEFFCKVCGAKMNSLRFNP